MAGSSSETAHGDEERPVSDSDSERRQLTEQPKRKHKRSVVLAFVALVIIIIAVAIALAVRLSLRDGGKHHQVIDNYLSSLVQSRLATVSFHDASTPEYKTLEWMTEVDQYPGKLSDDRLLQRFAMAAMIFHIGGLDDLLNNDKECLWELSGSIVFPCEMVTELKVLRQARNTTIPITLGLMTDLTSLSLKYNDFAGTIPSEIGMLTNLASLVFFPIEI